MKILDRIQGRIWAMLLLTAGMAFTACDGILEEEEMDCTYTVRFKYDMNMKFADAFANEVKSVALYAFKDGKLVYQQVDDNIPAMESNTYEMRLDGLKGGEYELITWAGLEDQASFVVPLLQEGASMEELTCKMNRNHGTRAGEGDAYVDKDLKPLFHGKITHEFSKSNRQALVPLTKNTNVVRVILQHLSAKEVDVEEFGFRIVDENGHMDYDNSLIEDEVITYYAWDAYSGTAGINNPETDATTSVSVAVAELTVARLLTDMAPTLYVTNRETGEDIISIPLKDYALLVKGNYNRPMDDQEYLDRQDEYNLTFFLDESKKWINTQIVINNWVVRFNDMSGI